MRIDRSCKVARVVGNCSCMLKKRACACPYFTHMSVTTKRGQATAHSARAEGAGPQVTSLSSHTCATPNDKVRHLYLNQAPGMLDAAATTRYDVTGGWC